MFKGQFDRAGFCEALLLRHGDNAAVGFPAIARSEFVAGFTRLTRIGIKVRTAINTIRLRVGRRLRSDLGGGREDGQQTRRKAGNYAHNGLPPGVGAASAVAMGRPAAHWAVTLRRTRAV